MNISRTGALLLVLFLGYSIGYFSYSFSQNIVLNEKNVVPPFESKKIQEAYTYIEKYYYGFHNRTESEKEDALIDALTKSLGDKYTSYFNPEDAVVFKESLSGDFEGIGAVIKEHIKGIQIMKVLKDSPAQKNNLLKGDIILQIGNISTIGMLAEDAVDVIRGPKGTSVTLSILSQGTERNVEIKRDKVIIPSINFEILSGTTLGYIEIGFFGEKTTEEFDRALKSLNGSGVTGIIIDGRNNGGGYLDSAVDIVSKIISERKLVVSTRGIRPSENMDYFTQKQKYSNSTIPIVMLINNMSASATEILAGATQDYDRAIIIGQKSFGKGSVQEPFILSDGSMMKITIAKWFTPKDRGIDEKGIEPDIGIKLTDDDYKNIYDRQLEGAKMILTDIISKKISVSEYKKDKEAIEQVLRNNKIYE